MKEIDLKDCPPEMECRVCPPETFCGYYHYANPLFANTPEAISAFNECNTFVTQEMWVDSEEKKKNHPTPIGMAIGLGMLGVDMPYYTTIDCDQDCRWAQQEIWTIIEDCMRMEGWKRMEMP